LLPECGHFLVSQLQGSIGCRHVAIASLHLGKLSREDPLAFFRGGEILDAGDDLLLQLVAVLFDGLLCVFGGDVRLPSFAQLDLKLIAIGLDLIGMRPESWYGDPTAA
jgi:hypothetical protein